MKTLTISERHDLYKLALIEIESDRQQFICIALRNLIDVDLSCVETNSAFPELISRKPNHIYGELSPWFHGDYQKRDRIALLNELIKETSQKAKPE